MKSNYNLLLFLCLSMLCTYTYNQEISVAKDTVGHEQKTVEHKSKKSFDFFASEEPLQMTLCFDVKEFLKTKSQPQYYDATLTVKINETDTISQNIKVKARGESRRIICSFPPVMLKFFKDTVNKTERPLGKGTLKLVTQCKPSSIYEGYIFKEYLAYRLYNLVTPYSFKTRLVKINYVDIYKPNKPYTTVDGFLIENENKMAKRNNTYIVHSPKVTQRHMNSLDMARVAVFNYMIGNTDWSVPGQHNVKILQSQELPSAEKGMPVELKGIPVAFDFDYSGLVNTDYAVPCGKGLPIENVTDRYYLGLCYRNEELVPIIDELGALKEQILSTINDFEYLSKSDKNQVASYIESFYKMYKNQNLLISEMTRTCKQF